MKVIKKDPLAQLTIVCYGGGLDSTAMLIEMYNQCIRPDIILFADTGSEKPETYAYLDTMDEWLVRVGFPKITRLAYEPTTAPYRTLEDKCLANEGLPSLSYKQHSCSLVFKVAVQNKYLKNHPLVKAEIAAGRKIAKYIGYDASEADMKRSKKATQIVANQVKKVRRRQRCIDMGWKYLGKKIKQSVTSELWEYAHFDLVYPLQGWRLGRKQLKKIIEDAGQPVPMKSACFFCPASTPAEVVWLKNTHPDLYRRSLAIEDNARHGKHGLKSNKGLPMDPRWSWEDLKDCDDPDQAAAHLESKLGIRVKNGLRP